MNKMKLRNKMILGFGIIIILTILLGVLSVYSQIRQEELNNEMEEIDHLITEFLRIENAHFDWIQDVNEFIMNDEINTLNVELDGTKCAFGEFIYSDHIDEDLSDYPNIMKKIDDIKEIHLKVHESAHDIEELYFNESKDASIKLFFSEVKPNMDIILTTLNDIRTDLEEIEEVMEEDIKNQILQLEIFTIIVIIIIIIICIFIAFILFRTVTKPIRNLSETAGHVAQGKMNFKKYEVYSDDELGRLSQAFNKLLEVFKNKSELVKDISEGDLTVEVNLASDEDELGIAIRNMVLSLNQIMTQIQVSVEQVNQGAEQISDSSQTLSQGASQQASSLEEITASINELSSQVQMNVENVRKTDELARTTNEIAAKGNQQMKELVKAMNDINNSIEDINKIIKVIDEIAFQTNLLALNADIEAARVGKYGKGFAVVAGSVRNLAKKSTDSVKNTSQMIEGVIKNIEKGNRFVNVTAEQLEKIVEVAIDVTELSTEVLSASQEQANGIEQISTGLSQIEDVVQSNSASAEENAAASEELAGQATTLKELISKFRLNKDQQRISSNIKSLTTKNEDL